MGWSFPLAAIQIPSLLAFRTDWAFPNGLELSAGGYPDPVRQIVFLAFPMVLAFLSELDFAGGFPDPVRQLVLLAFPSVLSFPSRLEPSAGDYPIRIQCASWF